MKFPTVKCKNCGLEYVSPTPTDHPMTRGGNPVSKCPSCGNKVENVKDSIN